MSYDPTEIPDPRDWPTSAAASDAAQALYALAEESLTAAIAQRADAIDREVASVLRDRLSGDGNLLDTIFTQSPSVAVTRYLWRTLDSVWREAMTADDRNVAVTIFALPVVIVTGLSERGESGALSGIVDHPQRLADLLRESGALSGNRAFAFSNALVGVEAIDTPKLPQILTWRNLPEPAGSSELPIAHALPPSPISYHDAGVSAHLRFLVGSAIAKAGIDLLARTSPEGWGVGFTRELTLQLEAPRVSVLALPRAPQHLLPAVWQGRVAQREVSAQLFASNAIRKFRSTVGEPTAVISAHRVPHVDGGGELRVSLSSAFDERANEGFRCPLYRLDRVGDVVSMLVDLLRDCRVADIRAVPGIHADSVAGTGLPLLFGPDTIPDASRFSVH